MKYCKEYAALLDLFVDGELPPGEMERVQAHLGACPGCRAYVDDALAIRAGFPGVEETAVPEGFAGSVMERVREDAGRDAKIVELRRRSVRRWTGTLAALAACCALVVILRAGPGDGGAAVATAGDGEAAPAAYDAAGTEESAAVGIAPQAEPAPQSDSAPRSAGEAAPENGQAESWTMAKEDLAYSTGPDAEEYMEIPEEEEVPLLALPAEAAPEGKNASGDETAALRLTAEEAGGLLDGFAPVREDAASASYELSAGEYRALLEKLGRPEELAGGGEARFLVVVTRATE